MQRIPRDQIFRERAFDESPDGNVHEKADRAITHLRTTYTCAADYRSHVSSSPIQIWE